MGKKVLGLTRDIDNSRGHFLTHEIIRTLMSGIGLVEYVYNSSLNKTNMHYATTINVTKEKETMIMMQHWNRLYFPNLRIAFKTSIKN